jgi:hypothetical protein
MMVNEEILPFMSKNYIENKKIIFGLNACLKTGNDNDNIQVGDEIKNIKQTDPI